MKRRSVFGAYITIGSYREFIDGILSLACGRIPSYVCFANAHMIVEAFRNPSFQRVVNEADLVAPDGKPVSTYLSLAQNARQDRVCGMDIFPDVLRSAAERGASVYFYGSTSETLNAICEKAKGEFPTLTIAGSFSPPFRDLSDDEKTKFAEMVKAAKPHLVFVSLGCPKQEKWMAENKDRIGACLMGLGQAFNVYAGTEKRLPAWMRALSLEWAYRLYLEPRRLWRRYLITNTYFIYLTLRQIATVTLSAVFPQFRKTNL